MKEGLSPSKTGNLKGAFEINKLPLKEFIRTIAIGNRTNKEAKTRKIIINVFEVIFDFISFQSPSYV
jgi:hypothetical protein